MPCNTIQTVGVELGKSQPDLLMKALEEMGLNPRRVDQTIYFGYRERFDIETGQMQVQPSRDVAAIKRAYSHQVVRSQAQKFGWQLKAVGENKYEVVRR